jgi:ABC-type polysaccharide/polyol phosphate transport system ATPase subunit
MSELAIQVDGLSKRYRVGTRVPYRTLRDTLTNAASRAAGWLRSAGRSSTPAVGHTSSDLFWALRHVTFEVPRGSVVGVIGRNGAGKSTLLKVLSQITEPTEGLVQIRGRVGSLLEVGTGFHPELTGRENVFLNGAILGMHKAEITRKFDEIVAFGEVDKFIDTPVKHFSSGMYMRLAFAVAAHLEPDILMVDEVLAVGDAQFQQKCLGKIGEVASEGRTVVLVSHQMNQIRRLCSTCVWLEHGEVRQLGPGVDVVSAYEDSYRQRTQAETPARRAGAHAHFVSWAVEGAEPDAPATLLQDEDPAFVFRLHVASRIGRGHHGIALFNSDNLLIWAYAFDGLTLDAGEHELRYGFPSLPITPGVYRWQLSLYSDGALVDLWDALPALYVHTSLKTHSSDSWQGVLNPSFSMALRRYESATRAYAFDI